MELLIIELAQKYPIVMSVFAVIGILRAIFKPLMTLLEAYVGATESTKDDLALEKAKSSRVYAGLVWLLDYTASIKVGKLKK